MAFCDLWTRSTTNGETYLGVVCPKGFGCVKKLNAFLAVEVVVSLLVFLIPVIQKGTLARSLDATLALAIDHFRC